MAETCNIFTYKVKSIKNTTPGSIHSNRTLVFSKNKSLVATGKQLVLLDLEELPNQYNKIESKIKGIPTPSRIDDNKVKETLYNTDLPYEIQSISSTSSYDQISCIDSKGNLWIAKCQDSKIEPFYQIPVTPNQYIELGWAGSSFNPNNSEIIAKTQFFTKKLEIYDRSSNEPNQPIHSIQLMQNPTQIKYFQQSNSQHPLLAISEFNQLKIYDTRLPLQNMVIQKITPQQSPDWIYNMSISEDGNYIGVGGQNRSVYVYDTRKWTCAGSWKNCLKYEVTSVLFSSTKSSMCYAGGLDSEVLAGEWNGTSGVDHFTGLRVDSKWMGISKLKSHEFLFGFTSSGSVYWIDHAQKLFQPKITRLLSPEPSGSPNPTPHKKLKLSNNNIDNNNSDSNNNDMDII